MPDWQGRLKEIEATFRVAHEVVPIEKALGDFFMSPPEKERLRGGQIAFRDRPGGGTVYLRRIRGSDRALRIEWVGAYEYLALYYTIIVALVMTAMAAILWRWSRPLWRDLEGLKAATARVGEGDFELRARVNRGSMLEPIASAFNVMARSKVAVTVEHDGTRTVISVDDDGPGVPPAERERLFEPFTRLEGSRGRDSGGVGLGLAIVKSVAEWHGGEARIADSPLGGARVSIAWPQAPAKVAAARAD